MSEPTQEVRPKRKQPKITRAQLKVFTRALRAMAREGIAYPEMAAQMNRQGFRHPGGGKLTHIYLGQMCRREKIKTSSRRSVAREATKVSKRLPETVLGILTDSHLTDGQKVKMLIAYADV